MLKWTSLLICISFHTGVFASVDIDLACKEKKEQEMSLLNKMSTSLTEANLAGQCTGYTSYYKIEFNQVCPEFIEQKRALLSSLSTSLSEANLAGQCIGAIYRLAKKCKANTTFIDYLHIAENSASWDTVKVELGCYRGRNGW